MEKKIEVIANNKKEEKAILKIVKASGQSYEVGSRGLIVNYTPQLAKQLSGYITFIDEWI